MSFFVCLKDEKQILFKGDETLDPMAENKSQKKISWCTKILKNSLNFFNKFKINQCKNNLSLMKDHQTFINSSLSFSKLQFLSFK